MKEKELRDIVKPFLKVLHTLDVAGIQDEKLWSRFAEYLTAWGLTKNGNKVQILNERTNKRARSADIYLPEKDIRIEVKTGKRSYGSCTASFGKGTQIKEGKFDYCVFLTYGEERDEECFIFSREELMEVAEKPRPKLAAHPTTNPCMLFRYNSFADLEKSLGKDALRIEIELHKHPERFKNRWDKIDKQSQP